MNLSQQKKIIDNSNNISNLLLSSEIFGLLPANDISDANNDISISSGYCLDSNRVRKIKLNTSLIKRTDAIFAEGSGVGCMDQIITSKILVNRARNGSNVATLTFNDTTGLVSGMTVRISSVGGTGYNGQFVITVAGSTISYTNIGGSETTTTDTTGRLDTSKGLNSSIYLFAISKEDATSDILASLSSSQPLMPSGYTYKRIIGSLLTDGSGNIRAGTWTRINVNQIKFIHSSYIPELVNGLASTQTLITVSSPPLTIASYRMQLNTVANSSVAAVYETSIPDFAPSVQLFDLFAYGTGAGVNGWDSNSKDIIVDSNRQIAYRIVTPNTQGLHICCVAYTQTL